MIKRYIIYGLIGWNTEVIWTGMHSLMVGDLRLSGFTNLWMFFIYGLAVFLEPIHDIISRWRWITRGIIWVLVIWGIEYATGFILENIINLKPWLYSGPYAVDGLIRLDYAPWWFAAGLIFEKIHRTLDVYILDNRV
ncbi:putative ABC transporter permease [Pseudobacteroides cellulosolvens]|uniref:ABC-transporter type IV n=2 Tax=Pseudobacteroides cellulosolvens TaxID=35825 RepID=A0A0L6JML6_9FIRM|nr:membrane protein [Pseudobacteroides cellulosolvens]KNY27003.1 protein of unknown function DUF1113 [Pseudobacteroides cellulosolvens ATCC 35603 = DSM 2933]